MEKTKNTSFLTTLLSFFFIALSSSSLYSQPVEEYVGTAQGRDLQIVRESAFQNLAQQIQVFISSKSYRETREDNKALKDSLFSSTLAQSFMSLTDVRETIDKIDNDNFRVTKSVAKVSVQKMFDMRRKRILDYLNDAERILNEYKTKTVVSLQSVLDDYYQAYLLNLLYPDTITYSFDSQAASVAVGIPNRMSALARSLEFIPIKQIDDDYIVWQYSVRYNGKAVLDFHYSFFDGMGQSEGMVHNGEAQLTLYYSHKENKERQSQIQMEFPSPDELDNTLSMASKFLNTAVLQKTITIIVPAEKTAIQPFPQEKPVSQVIP
ncbi:MAG: hypothetical protein WAV76_07970, partial [Bacteroidota bacterium]